MIHEQGRKVGKLRKSVKTFTKANEAMADWKNDITDWKFAATTQLQSIQEQMLEYQEKTDKQLATSYPTVDQINDMRYVTEKDLTTRIKKQQDLDTKKWLEEFDTVKERCNKMEDQMKTILEQQKTTMDLIDRIAKIELIKDAIFDNTPEAPTPRVSVSVIFSPANFWKYKTLENSKQKRNITNDADFLHVQATVKFHVIKIFSILQQNITSWSQITAPKIWLAAAKLIDSRRISPATFKLAIFGLFALLNKWNFDPQIIGGPAFKKSLLVHFIPNLIRVYNQKTISTNKRAHDKGFIKWLWKFFDDLEFVDGLNPLELFPKNLTDLSDEVMMTAIILLQLVTGGRSPEIYDADVTFFQNKLFYTTNRMLIEKTEWQPVVAVINISVNKASIYGVVKHWTILWAVTCGQEVILTPPAKAICCLRAKTLLRDKSNVSQICPYSDRLAKKFTPAQLTRVIHKIYKNEILAPITGIGSYTTKRTLVTLALVLNISPTAIQNFITWNTASMVDRYLSDNKMRFGKAYLKLPRTLRTYLKFVINAHDYKCQNYTPAVEMLLPTLLFETGNDDCDLPL